MESDVLAEVVSAAAFTATGMYLLVRLVTYLRGRRPALHPRVLALFELRREPPIMRRPALSLDVWIAAAILVVCEYVAVVLLSDALVRRDASRVGLWLLHFVAISVWTSYVWRR